MNDALLLRVLGTAAILGGALRIGSAFIPWAPGQAWLELLYLAVDVLLLFGLMGIYLACRDRVGVIGFIAFAIAETGIASIVGPDGVVPAYGIDTYQLGVLVITVGLTFFAIVQLVARAGPLWAPLCWVASMLVGVGGSFGGDPETGFLIGGVLFGLGFIVAGWPLVSPGNRVEKAP
jgi:hypothetical protein